MIYDILCGVVMSSAAIYDPASLFVRIGVASCFVPPYRQRYEYVVVIVNVVAHSVYCKIS